MIEEIAAWVFFSPFVLILLIVILVASIKIIDQYERGIRFTFGKFSGQMEPGLNVLIPLIQTYRKIDIRTNVLTVPKQETMTKDNVSIEIDAVLYFKVADPQKAIIQIENYYYATMQIAQTTMRELIGETTLDELLTSREKISKRIQEIVSKTTASWGIKIEGVELKEIQLPQDLIRIIGKEAEAEREKRAVIIKASGELEASKSLAKAAKELSQVPGGLHIRMLQTINNLGNEKSMTHIITTPTEVMEALMNWKK
jgi:regulator of protease activity HflC (stomatin/prohibitin superfamily)